MSEDQPQYYSNTDFALTIMSEEFPLRSFLLFNARSLGLQFIDDPLTIVITITKSEFENLTDLQLSQFSLLLFSLLCCFQFQSTDFAPAVSVRFAAKMDRLPKMYAQLWSESFKAMKSSLIQLD